MHTACVHSNDTVQTQHHCFVTPNVAHTQDGKENISTKLDPRARKQKETLQGAGLTKHNMPPADWQAHSLTLFSRPAHAPLQCPITVELSSAQGRSEIGL